MHAHYDHYLFPTLLAPVLGIIGFSLALGILRLSLRQNDAQRMYWTMITATVMGTTAWATAFLLAVSHFGTPHQGMDRSLIFAAFLSSVIGCWLVLHGFKNRNNIFWHVMARFGPGIVFVGMCLLTMWAFAPVDLPPPMAMIVIASLCALAIAVFGWIDSNQDFTIPYVQARFNAVVMTALIVACHFSLGIIFERPDQARLTDPDLFGDVLFVAAAVLLIDLIAGSSLRLDQTRTAESVEEFRNLALHDSLTSLPNRLNMHMSLDRWIDQWQEANGPICVAVIDLDRFKDVNDVHGHAAGDALLKELGQQLLKDLGSEETIYRTGGDEFVAVKRDVGSREGANQFAKRLIGSVNGFDAWMTGDVRIGATVGVCLFPADGDSTGELLSRADLAMYRAKALGRGQSCQFDMAMDEARRAKKSLSMDLHRAIREDELEIYWQPQIDNRTGALVGFEALLRWDHPERGRIPPSEFIPLAEQTGQILDVGEWVLLNACKEAASWQRPYRVSINVAAGQVNQCDLPTLVRSVLDRTGLSATRLELEITETGIIRDFDRAYETVWQIKEMGVGLAMDDFGTGYSSLSTLQSFPFDKIKIDRAFIAEIGKSKSADAIVQATTQIAHAMGMKVLAEGVETLEQISKLDNIGCYEMQGFYFSRPLKASDLRSNYRLMEDDLAQFEADQVEEANISAANRAQDGASGAA